VKSKKPFKKKRKLYARIILYNSLFGFRKVFSRHHIWLIFTIIVLGFIGCSEMVGVTSLCRLVHVTFWDLLKFGNTAKLTPQNG
jgi:hypothetical protein